MVIRALAAVVLVVVIVTAALELVGVVLKILVVRLNARRLEEFRVLAVDEELLVLATTRKRRKDMPCNLPFPSSTVAVCTLTLCPQ